MKNKFKKGDLLLYINTAENNYFETNKVYEIKHVFRDTSRILMHDEKSMEWIFETRNEKDSFYVWKFFDQSEWIRRERRNKLNRINSK